MEKSNESFDALIQKSYDFSREKFDNNPKWGILRDLYNKNFIANAERNYENMPKKIHQIWLGSTIPKVFKDYADTWSKCNPDWEYRLWGDKDVGEVEIPNRALFNSIRHLGQKSDFLRYHILNQFGGIYADTDFECLKSFNSLSYLDFLIGVGYPLNVELYIGLMGSIPHHPVLEMMIKEMNTIKDGGWKEVFETTGTYFFTRNFFKVVDSDTKDVVALPTDYFYPFPNQWGHEHRNGKNYIKECSYAVHHWAVSWCKKW